MGVSFGPDGVFVTFPYCSSIYGDYLAQYPRPLPPGFGRWVCGKFK